MKKYQPITKDTSLSYGDKIRRPLGEGRFDYMILGKYDEIDGVYEVNLPGKPRLVDAVSVYAYISKKNMIAQNYEVFS